MNEATNARMKGEAPHVFVIAFVDGTIGSHADFPLSFRNEVNLPLTRDCDAHRPTP
jgi:hypothetical protein